MRTGLDASAIAMRSSFAALVATEVDLVVVVWGANAAAEARRVARMESFILRKKFEFNVDHEDYDRCFSACFTTFCCACVVLRSHLKLDKPILQSERGANN